MSLDRAAAHAIQVRAMRDWLRWLGQASPGAQVLELPGVSAAVVPAVPGRSIVNGVVYEGPADLERGYETLARAYGEAGVSAWTVWTPEFDERAQALLAARGHALDGEPAAMVLELEHLRAPAARDLDWQLGATPEEMGAVNDAAYGYSGEDSVAAAFGPPDPGIGMRCYRARSDAADPACVLATIDHADDTGVYFVATHPEARGRQLASRLLGLALAEAHGRGQRTASLQASAMGAGLYRRLGFEEAFRLRMYEWREEAAPAGG